MLDFFLRNIKCVIYYKNNNTLEEYNIIISFKTSGLQVAVQYLYCTLPSIANSMHCHYQSEFYPISSVIAR